MRSCYHHILNIAALKPADKMHLCLPHEPELEDIDMPSTLDGLVARVVCDVVLFIWLEEVTGAHGVAAL